MQDKEQFHEVEIGDDLQVTETTRRAAGGTWVRGRLNGHRFEALVFPQHAEASAWELGNSRLSTLWLRREADREVVYHWDRGEDVPAADPMTQALVNFLAAGIAEHVYGD